MSNIYEFITTEETAYQTRPITVVEEYEWSMFRHIKLSTLYKNGQLETGKTDDKPVKNIVRPILNVAYRSEGFDVKDIEPFVNDSVNYYKSFLVRKYHRRFARKYDLDTFIDDVVESYIDYGLGLIKDANGKVPERVPLQMIAFCDQTDILSGPICLKHQYSPDQLLETEALGWGNTKKGATATLDEVIILSKAEKTATETQGEKKNKTPGKYIEVYELHGMLPEDFLKDNGSPDKYVKQIQIVCFYKDQQGEKQGITLFKGKEKDPLFKAIKRDPIYGRACGFGGVEELFEPQVWTTYSMIQIKQMLDVAADIIIQTEDASFKNKNKLTDREKGEIVIHAAGKPLSQVNIQPINLVAFEKAVQDWELHARTTGSANDAQLGINPTSGTPFALQNLITATGQGLHEYRRGKIATFFAEIYRDWILPQLVSEMNKGDEWLDELSLDELQYISDQISTNEANKEAVRLVLAGKMPTQEEIVAFRDKVKADWLKGGAKKFIKIVENEFNKIPMDVEVNIAGKQKDLSKMTDKLVNIFRQIIANPVILQNPALAKIFNEILEYSGLSPVDFSGIKDIATPAPTPQPQPQIINK